MTVTATATATAKRAESVVPDPKGLLVATKPFAREHRWVSWWHLWSTLGVFAALIAIVCLDISYWLRVPVSILAGLVMVRLFILYHDFQHGTILRGSRLAKAMMALYGLLTLNPPSIWNRSHEHHHKNNAKIYGASIGSYPVMTVADYQKASRSERLAYAVSRHPLTIGLGYLTVFLYGMCIRSLIVNPRMHRDSALSLGLHLGLIGVLAIVAPEIALLALILPSTVAAALGAYLFYAQHNFPGVELRDRAEWDYVAAALASSSYMKTGRLMGWFTGNIGYHHLHHLNARIPFYRLPEAMAALPETQSPKITTLWPWDIWRCLRLKLWDTERNELVPWPRKACG